jgi:hypothetical protein
MELRRSPVGVGTLVAIAVVLAAVIGAGAGLVASALRPGDPEPESLELPPGPSQAYAQAIRAPTTTLRRSARALGRSLGRSASAEDLEGLTSLARAQLGLLRRAERQVGRLPAGPIDQEIHRQLAAAVAAHLTLASGIARLDFDRPQHELERLSELRRAAEEAKDNYDTAYAALGRPSPVAGAGIADLDGLERALTDRRDQLRELFRPAPEAPVITDVQAFDVGGEIEVGLSYCDRSAGAVQDFIYRARVVDAEYYESAESFAEQSAACNTITL